MLETLKNAWRTPDIRQKILYTLLILFLFRVGADFIPVAGVNASYIAQQVEQYEIFGFLNLMTGGSFAQFTIFALGISPYITASIMMPMDSTKARMMDTYRVIRWIFSLPSSPPSLAIRSKAGMAKVRRFITMDAGDLVPDDVVIGIAVNRIAQPDCEKGWLFDGFPRTIAQAIALDEKVSVDLVINIDVKDEEIVERLSGRRVCKQCGATFHVSAIGDASACSVCGGELIQRADDNAETVRNRLAVYHQQTSPLVEYYRKKGLLGEVKGNGGIEAVFEEICRIIDNAK